MEVSVLNKIKIMLINLIFTLGYSGIISAGLGENLSAVWGRATATREGQVGTAVVLTAVTVATCYGLYKLNLAFKEYYAAAKPKLAAWKSSTSDEFTPLMRLAQRAHEHNVGAEAEGLITGAVTQNLSDCDYVNQGAKGSVFTDLKALHLALLTYDNSTTIVTKLKSSAVITEQQRNIIEFIKVLLRYGTEITVKQAEHPALKLAQAEIATDVDASKVVVVEDDNSGSGGATESKQELVGAAAVPENTLAQNLALYFRLLNETNLGPEQYANNWQEVEQLLNRGLIDVNSRDEHGLSGLMIAIKNVNLAMVSCLLRHGADIRARTWFLGDDLTPMMFLAFADTTIVLYQEAHVLEIIKNINERELLLLQRDMCNGTIATAIYAPKSLDDQKFEELMRGAFPAEIALKFTRRYIATKYVIALFSKAEPFSFRKWLGFR